MSTKRPLQIGEATQYTEIQQILLNTIAHISLLSKAVTAVITKKSVSYRSAKYVRRIA